MARLPTDSCLTVGFISLFGDRPCPVLSAVQCHKSSDIFSLLLPKPEEIQGAQQKCYFHNATGKKGGNASRGNACA